MATQISSPTSSPPQPSKRFSSRNTWTWPRSSARSLGDSRRKNKTFRLIVANHPSGKGRARRRRRRRCFSDPKITGECKHLAHGGDKLQSRIRLGNYVSIRPEEVFQMNTISISRRRFTQLLGVGAAAAVVRPAFH